VDSFGNGVASYSKYFPAGSTQIVGLIVNNNNDTAPLLENVYKVGSPLQVNISFIKKGGVGEYVWDFYPSSTVTGTVAYNWDFGDSTYTLSGQPTHTYTSPGFYTVKLTTSLGAETCISKCQVPAQVNQYAPHSSFTSSFTPVPNSLALSGVTLQFTDNTGAIYSTAGVDQPLWTKFNIESVEDYKDAGNIKTKKVKINFDCLLKHVGGAGTTTIKNGKAIIALGYQ
jgi:hypothetical protein